MKNTDLRAKARAIFGSAVAEPMPNQPNGAKALQQRANARPIPTYKVGGPVKKMPMPGDSVASGNRMSKMEADERRFMDMMDKKKKMPSARDAVDSGNRVNRLEGAEMRKMQMAKGGKAGRYADGGTVDENEMLVTGMRPRNVSYNMPPMGSNAGESMGSGMQASGGGAPYAPVAPRPTVKRAPPLGIRSTAGFTGPTADLGDGRVSFGVGRNRSLGAGLRMPFKNGGKVETSADNAAKMGNEKGSMKKGGKANKYADGGAPAAKPYGQTTAEYGANLRNQIKAGTMTNAQAQAAQNAFAKQEMARRTAADAAATAAKPYGQVTAAYGANLRDNIKAGTMTNAQAQAAQNAFAKQELARRTQPPIQRAKGGKVQTSADTAEKLATEMGGMKKGGKAPPKSGLAVMIAIGKAKPIKKMNGGPMAARAMDMESSKVTRQMAGGGDPMGYAAGGAGKMRKGQAPIKKAQGGAAKVRKGMMTPEGQITHAMNKIRG